MAEILLNIYTDGACRGNQLNKNAGGWGAVLEYGEHKKELCGGELNTTNNRMEMTALLEAFKAIKKDGQTIRVFSDSSYLMDCFRKKWYVKWQKNGWQTAAKKDVENQDLWKLLLPYLEKHTIYFFRVKGHIDPGSLGSDAKSLKLYGRFIEWNGTHFSFDDFKYITKMNNKADELANRGIDKLYE